MSRAGSSNQTSVGLEVEVERERVGDTSVNDKTGRQVSGPIDIVGSTEESDVVSGNKIIRIAVSVQRSTAWLSLQRHVVFDTDLFPQTTQVILGR